MRLYLFLSVVFSVVLALYKKNMMFTIMPGKTTCFLKKVARYKVIEVEYQVLAREGVRSNLSIAMDVIAPHVRTRSRVVTSQLGPAPAHVVTSQRGPAGAHVLDAAVAGVYRFCFDNSFDDKNKKTILFNLVIRSKKNLLKKKLGSGKDKQLGKKLKRIKNKKKQNEMLAWLRDKEQQEEILKPQRKGKKHTNSSTKKIKKKKKKKGLGSLKNKNKNRKQVLRQPLKKTILQAQKQKEIFADPTETLLKWSFDDKNINLKLLQVLEGVTQEMHTTAKSPNNKDINFIPFTETKLTQSLIQPTTKRNVEEILIPSIYKLKEEEKTSSSVKKNVLQNDIHAHSRKTMKKNYIKDNDLKEIVTNKIKTRPVKPMHFQKPIIKPTYSEEILNNEDEDDYDETMLTPEEETATESNNMTRGKTERYDFHIIDNILTTSGLGVNYPATENMYYNANTESYPLVESEKKLDVSLGDYPSIDYSAGSNERWDRADSSKSTMWMPYGWDMVY